MAVVYAVECSIARLGGHRQVTSPVPQPSFTFANPRKAILTVRVCRASASPVPPAADVRTCRICKQTYTPAENHPRACRHHTAHFGGETKRKFEGVNTGGTMDTVGGGEITAYWHCCGSKDPFDLGCEAGPHMSYDD
eukprot:TRINITY_DN39530_c0_g2_i1.p1 TRINITY_DN39530_c0_g2~~TRINITY_DN39530_c0_g2_i1.p1  ORF type:complete len:149 (+),score=3.30 TRINITY_DN39530_c0_g2_i1:37-447(+)